MVFLAAIVATAMAGVYGGGSTHHEPAHHEPEQHDSHGGYGHDSHGGYGHDSHGIIHNNPLLIRFIH